MYFNHTTMQFVKQGIQKGRIIIYDLYQDFTITQNVIMICINYYVYILRCDFVCWFYNIYQ